MTPRTGPRPLNDYPIDSGGITGIQTGDAVSTRVPVFQDSEVVGAVVHIDTLLGTSGGVAQTFDVLVNDADSGVDLQLGDLQAADTGAIATPTAKLYVYEGDSLQLRSNNEQVAATNAFVAFIIRR